MDYRRQALNNQDLRVLNFTRTEYSPTVWRIINSAVNSPLEQLRVAQLVNKLTAYSLNPEIHFHVHEKPPFVHT